MAETRLFRAEAVLPISWHTTYGYGYTYERVITSVEHIFLGYFKYEDAIETVAEYINESYYEEPNQPDDTAVGDTIEFIFVPEAYIPPRTRRSIIYRSLMLNALTIQQAAELNIEFAHLGGGLTPTYSPNLAFLGFYAKDYALKRWGKKRESERYRGKFVVNARAKENVRYNLLKAQLLAPNHEELGATRLQTLALALRPLILKRLSSGKGPMSDLKDLLHLVAELNGNVYAVYAKSGSLVGHFKEAQVLELWKNYTADDNGKVIRLNVDIPDEERAQYLREELGIDKLLDGKRTLEVVESLSQIGDDIDSAIVHVYTKLLHDRDKAGVPTIPHNADWKSLFRRVRTCIDGVEHDPVAGGLVLGKIRSEFGGNSHGSFVSVSKRAFAAARRETVTLNGEEFDPEQVITLALVGHKEATALLAEVLLIEAEGNVAVRYSRRVASDRDEREVNGEDLPEWAKSERAFLLEWADKAIEKEPAGLVDDIAHFIAKRIREGGVNVLVFDAELYFEVTSADIVGKGAGGIEEFPFPMTVVRMTDSPGIYGIAVFRRQDFRRAAITEIGRCGKYADGYEVAYVLSKGGVTLDPDPQTASIGEKLTTYLDCDNAMIDTVYIDGGTPSRRNSPRLKTEGPEYVRGADFIVGTQVVTTRGRQSRGAKKIFKRAHFRRGFYKRQRVGPRDSWHYETRWIKPTFVHGGDSIVTERRVKRLLL